MPDVRCTRTIKLCSKTKIGREFSFVVILLKLLDYYFLPLEINICCWKVVFTKNKAVKIKQKQKENRNSTVNLTYLE